MYKRILESHQWDGTEMNPDQFSYQDPSKKIVSPMPFKFDRIDWLN